MSQGLFDGRGRKLERNSFLINFQVLISKKIFVTKKMSSEKKSLHFFPLQKWTSQE